MKIGYARVSTLEQNLDLQLRALEKAGCKKIFREKVSGSNRERPQFQRMLDQIRVGDTIVVWKLDRLARSTRNLLETMELIREAGGKFRSLSEPWADTTTHAGKMIMTIFACIAEFERDLIRERTSAGGDLAGRRYGVETSICPSPVCQCERARLRCFPETTEHSPHASVPVCLEMDLEQCEIANFEELNSDPESITLAKTIANEISKADW